MGNRSNSIHNSFVPYCAPACTYVETAPASLSASITIKPGPKTTRKVRMLYSHLLRTTRPRTAGCAASMPAVEIASTFSCIFHLRPMRVRDTFGKAKAEVQMALKEHTKLDGPQ